MDTNLSKAKRGHMKLGLAVLGVLALTAAPVSAQGVVRGAQQGAKAGDNVAGPVGAAAGGVVGGVAGGIAGGVKGVLGIPQHTSVRAKHGTVPRGSTTMSRHNPHTGPAHDPSPR